MKARMNQQKNEKKLLLWTDTEGPVGYNGRETERQREISRMVSRGVSECRVQFVSGGAFVGG